MCANEPRNRERLIDNRLGHPFIMSEPSAAPTQDVRLFLFAQAAETTRVPQAAEIAAGLGRPVEEILAALRQLADGRAIVLEPDRTRIWAAPPFAATASNFRVDIADRQYPAVCVWDALGIPAALGAGDAVVRTTCGDCGEPMSLELRDGLLTNRAGVVHFGVPARHFWDDIVFT